MGDDNVTHKWERIDLGNGCIVYQRSVSDEIIAKMPHTDKRGFLRRLIDWILGRRFGL